jgi:quercetin dioxygenase-like cupin family protein
LYVTNRSRTEEKKTPSGASVWWLLAEEDGAPLFEMRYFAIARGASTTGSRHFFEHEVYVTRGEGKIEGDVETVSISEGDAVLILPREKHKIINTGGGTLEFICIIPKGKENDLK